MNEEERKTIHHHYQRRLETTSPADRRRLANARAAALSQSHSPGPLARWSWIPAGAAASLLVLLLWPGEVREPADTVSPEQVQVMADDMEILLAEEDLSFYAELDFYLWLEEEMDETS